MASLSSPQGPWDPPAWRFVAGMVCGARYTRLRPASVGRPLEHVEIRIAAPDSEIQVRSAAVAVGYLVERAIVPCRDREDWYHTRDVGSLHNELLSVGRRLRPPIWSALGPIPVE